MSRTRLNVVIWISSTSFSCSAAAISAGLSCVVNIWIVSHAVHAFNVHKFPRGSHMKMRSSYPSLLHNFQSNEIGNWGEQMLRFPYNRGVSSYATWNIPCKFHSHMIYHLMYEDWGGEREEELNLCPMTTAVLHVVVREWQCEWQCGN